MGDVPLPLNTAVSLTKFDQHIARLIRCKEMVGYCCMETGTDRLLGSKAGFGLEDALRRKQFAQSQPSEICVSLLRAAFIVYF